jgi:tRNA(Ile)-lysidine synthase
MPALLQRLREHVRRARLFPEPGIAVVAVSGGPDSVALLDLMHVLAPELGLSLVVAHADHGIRADSRTVGQAVGSLAWRYGLPFELGELGLGPDATETVARRARYAWLGEVRRGHGARYLVTAHHQDDQVETIVLRVLKGSAPAGLAGMQARGRTGGGGNIVRPLLGVTRAELAAHVAERGLPVHDDPANRDPRHLRSWLRVELLPLLLSRLGPRVRADLLRLGRAARSERRAWRQVVQLVPELHARFAPHGFDVARAGLGRYDDALSVALLRAAARRVGLVLGIKRARQLVAFARRPSGRQLSLGGEGGWAAEVAFDRLRVFRRAADAVPEVVATPPRGRAVFGHFRVTWAPEAAPPRVSRSEWTTWIAGGDWEVRAPRPGDRLVPLGGVGHRPVRRLLMEARVPRSARVSYPVVARGDTILWVPGICRSAADLPQPGTPAVRVDVIECVGPEAERRD